MCVKLPFRDDRVRSVEFVSDRATSCIPDPMAKKSITHVSVDIKSVLKA